MDALLLSGPPIFPLNCVDSYPGGSSPSGKCSKGLRELIADVVPLSTHSISVVGKTFGTTALTVYGPGKRLLAVADVVVSADVEGLKGRLADVLPN